MKYCEYPCSQIYYVTCSEKVYGKSLNLRQQFLLIPEMVFRELKAPNERKNTACHNNIRN